MVTLKQNSEIKIFPNTQDLFLAVAEDFTRRAVDAVKTKGVFTVALSGGKTPRAFFDVLTGVEFYKKQIPWAQIQFFFTDERYVSANDVESNYHMANEYLFSKAPIPAENIYRIPTEFSDPKEAAKNYELTLRKAFGLADHEFPKFDLLYLGLGEDGHVASLMPFSDIVETYTDPENMNLEKRTQLVAALWVPKLMMYRITLTVFAINQATNIVFLVTGANKASVTYKVLEGPLEPQRYPAQLIKCTHGKIIWYLEHAAAEKLKITSL